MKKSLAFVDRGKGKRTKKNKTNPFLYKKEFEEEQR